MMDEEPRPIKEGDQIKLLMMKRNECRHEDDRFFADCLLQLALYLERRDRRADNQQGDQ